jgi:hypothetical protein
MVVAMLEHVSVVNVIVSLEPFPDNNDSYGLGECCGGQQEYFVIYSLLELLVIFNMYCHHCT